MKKSNICISGKLLILLFLIQNLMYHTQCSPYKDSVYGNVKGGIYKYEELKYEDLEVLHVSCPSLDSCKEGRTHDTLSIYNCQCERSCTELDTCCIDSSFKSSGRQLTQYDIRCSKVYGEDEMDVFMVENCRRDWLDDGLVEDMCQSNGEQTHDPFLAVPVTSLKTGITYKNYFCSVCNEDLEENQLTFWDILVKSSTNLVKSPSAPLLKYNSTLQMWMAAKDERDNGSTPVTISMQIPENLLPLVVNCKTGLISECSINWTELSTVEKCSAYMAVVSIFRNVTTLRYRNPHCAICNFENVDDLDCSKLGSAFGTPVLHDTFFVGLFVMEDRKKKCRKNMVYDNLSKKCRIVKCPQNHVFKGKKCVRSNT